MSLEPDGGRRVLVKSVAAEGGCPACGVLSGRIKDRPASRVKDLPHGMVPLQVWVRKRRFLCTEKACVRQSFTETSSQLPARSRLTTPLRTRIGTAVSTTNRAMSEVGARLRRGLVDRASGARRRGRRCPRTSSAHHGGRD